MYFRFLNQQSGNHSGKANQMSMYNRRQLTPRNGHTLIAIIFARISGGPRQKEASIEDQIDHGKEVIGELHDGKVELRTYEVKAKGERIDRKELIDLEKQLRTREIDVLVAEDIGRMIRGAEASRLVGIAVDMGTRVLAPNDCIDTAEDDWEQDVIQACRDHVGHNIHGSKRIKQKLLNRFRKYGAATPCEIAGYVKPKGAETFHDWIRQESATPIVREGAGLLKRTLNCSVVADYFNSVGYDPGKYCRKKDRKWDGKMVRRYYKNTLLSGRPCRGTRHTVKHHESGRRVSVPNPEGPIFIDVPHLAHIDPVEQDELNDALRRRNACRGRKKVNDVDIRYQVPRKSTSFPSQHAKCFYCGYQFVRGANGIRDHIMCSNSRNWHCWNSVGVDCALAASKVTYELSSMLYELDRFDDQFRELVRHAYQNDRDNPAERWRLLEKNEAKLESQTRNLMNAVAEFGPSPELSQKLDELKRSKLPLCIERQKLEKLKQRALSLPTSVDELREKFESKFAGLAIDSPVFGSLLWGLVPEFHVFLVRLLDGGHPLPRARLRLNLTDLCPDLLLIPELNSHLTKVVVIDLYEAPERERIRNEAVCLSTIGRKQRSIAAELTQPTSQAVVQKALALNQLMVERGLEEPYELLLAPPPDYSKLRRHLNDRYEFSQLDGYEAPAL
jgi:site-specific DNA recombinase